MNQSSFKRLLVVAIVTMALGVTAGCAGNDSGAAATNADATVTPKAGSTVSAKVGKQFVVKLASNPTTGYQWAVKGTPKGVKFISSNYKAPKNNAAGAPGEQLLTFEPTQAGTWKVNLVYDRPFSPGKPGKSLTFSVDASKA